MHDMSVKWPNGVRSAVMLTFDFDAETLWLARDPENARRPGVLIPLEIPKPFQQCRHRSQSCSQLGRASDSLLHKTRKCIDVLPPSERSILFGRKWWEHQNASREAPNNNLGCSTLRRRQRTWPGLLSRSVRPNSCRAAGYHRRRSSRISLLGSGPENHLPVGVRHK